MQVVAGRLGALLMLLVAAPLAAQPGPAPQSGGSRIGFVNAAAVLRGMPGYAQAESTYVREMDAGRAEVAGLQAAFDSAVAQYQEIQATMSPADRDARERQLQLRRDSVVAQVQRIEARVAAREQELLAPIDERLRTVIDGVRAEGNYAMIIDLGSQIAAGIIAYDRSLDITLLVAQRLAGGNE